MNGEEDKDTADLQTEDVTESLETAETTESEEVEEVSEKEILANKVQVLEEEKKELEDKMLRQRAELENFKKRLLREKDEAIAFANTNLIKELLQFLDNLERAIEASKKGGDIKSLAEGVEMIRDQLFSALEKNWGLEKINPDGGEFIPQEHEACMAEVVPELETETVLQVLQPGYKLHSRVLRPAKVKIGKPE